MKLNLGCGPLPLHDQHYQVMQNPDEWTLVDEYITHPRIVKWNAEILQEVDNETCETIYASHLLEHISHRRVPKVLQVWYDKLKKGGTLIINVPDIAWVAKQINKYEQGQILTGVFDSFEGERGLQVIVYGSHEHEGEYHKAMFTKRSITELLTKIGFKDIVVNQYVDAHDFGILFVTCQK
jgi:predicted SAM-dependent methyltransferase